MPYSPFHWQPPAAKHSLTIRPRPTRCSLPRVTRWAPTAYRTTKQGKPLTLRLLVTTDSPANEVAGKLAVQWFKNVGVKVNLSIVDPGVLTSAQYQFTGKTYTPNWDMFMWYWTQDADPAFMVSIYTPAQSTGYGWNDCLWTNPAYTKLSNEAATTLNQAQRIKIVQQAQQIFYTASPYAIMAYPYQLEAWNTNKWTGWTQAPAGTGAAIYNYNNIDTYTHLQLKISAKSSGGANGGLIAAIVVAALVVVGIVIFLSDAGGPKPSKYRLSICTSRVGSGLEEAAQCGGPCAYWSAHSAWSTGHGPLFPDSSAPGFPRGGRPTAACPRAAAGYRVTRGQAR